MNGIRIERLRMMLLVLTLVVLALFVAGCGVLPPVGAAGCTVMATKYRNVDVLTVDGPCGNAYTIQWGRR